MPIFETGLEISTPGSKFSYPGSNISYSGSKVLKHLALHKAAPRTSSLVRLFLTVFGKFNFTRYC